MSHTLEPEELGTKRCQNGALPGLWAQRRSDKKEVNTNA
jgi:hypothetical protein